MKPPLTISEKRELAIPNKTTEKFIMKNTEKRRIEHSLQHTFKQLES